MACRASGRSTLRMRGICTTRGMALILPDPLIAGYSSAEQRVDAQPKLHTVYRVVSGQEPAALGDVPALSSSQARCCRDRRRDGLEGAMVICGDSVPEE